MVQSQFSLVWEGYQSSMCKGFSSLQQNGEFVDMTLAADGHLVKVHQILLALASPYFKELIHSAPCQHPVIFLNNVSHNILCNLLEYIYTGEVMVPAEQLSSFFDTAKALHIRGLEQMNVGDGLVSESISGFSQIEEEELCHVSGIKQVRIATGDSMEHIGLPAAARKIKIKQPPPTTPLKKLKLTPSQNTTYSEALDDNDNGFDDHDMEDELDTSNVSKSDQDKSKNQTNLQFTISNRGSLQVILNRFIYNLNSTAQRTGVRRWRCVDYRNNKCLAFVITKGNLVVNRANLHNHSFHDKKILLKIDKKAVYSAIDDVEKFREQGNTTTNKEDNMTESQDYMTLEGMKSDEKESMITI